MPPKATAMTWRSMSSETPTYSKGVFGEPRTRSSPRPHAWLHPNGLDAGGEMRRGGGITDATGHSLSREASIPTQRL